MVFYLIDEECRMLYQLGTGEIQRRLAGHLDRVTNVVVLSSYHDLISTSMDHNILYWQADHIAERLKNNSQLSNYKNKRKKKTIDYFNYNANEYFTGDQGAWKSDEEEEEEEDRVLKLLQDNWSDSD